MTDFKAQPRPDRAAKTTPSQPAHDRTEPAKPASVRARFTGKIGSTGRRAAVVAAACAVLLGAGAAGQASETGTRNSAGVSTQ